MNPIKLTAIHNDLQAAAQAVAPAIEALTGLGFSNIKIDVVTGARATPRTLLRDDKFDTIVCPGGKQGVDDCFYGENQWRWVRVDPRKVDGIKHVAIYETVLDAENNNAPGGRGEVIAVAPVLEYHVAATGPEEGKYCFILGEIETLTRPIPAGDLHLRNLRYTKLEDLRNAATLDELFSR